jgi:hypothetical protein
VPEQLISTGFSVRVGVEVCIVDPPRKGLEATLLDALCRPFTEPKSTLYHQSRFLEGGEPPSIPCGDTRGPAGDSAWGDYSGAGGGPIPATLQYPTPRRRGGVAREGGNGEFDRASDSGTTIAVEDGFEIESGGLHTLIYLSCGFAAFKRDCAGLLNSGQWSLQSASGFLFFPGTDSLEVLAVFKRIAYRSCPINSR